MAEGGERRILPDTIERCCASNFPPQTTQEHEQNARRLYEVVRYVNCELEEGPRLPEIVYRGSTGEEDIRHHVFRFDLRHYSDIFEGGLRAQLQEGVSNGTYFNLLEHVNNAGPPLVSQREVPRGFVSTTLSSNLATRYTNDVGTVVFRYEIYAPGGIFVGPTLGNRNNFPGQQEVAFVAGIAPQYIRAVQLFTITGYNNQGFARLERSDPLDPQIVLNMNFRLPQPDPEMPLRIENPACVYLNQENRRVPLKIVIYLCGGGEPRRERREVRANSEDLTATQKRYIHDIINYESYAEELTAIQKWYINDVVNCESYIDAAFRSSRANEAYVFVGNEFILLNYAPGTTNDSVVSGPQLICDGFPSLVDTPFGEYGIDCAFGTTKDNEAFIFCDNLCALWNYKPDSTDDKITLGPKTIASMFPFFKGTAFEKGVDAAFESSNKYEAYIFSGNQYARINCYDCYEPRLINDIYYISEGFPSLKNTIFQDGIEAAFASHRHNEAYIFKGKYYALINFAPGTKNDYVIGGVKEISPNWPSLRSILPRKNIGIDVHDHSHSKPAEGGGRPGHTPHDELK